MGMFFGLSVSDWVCVFDEFDPEVSETSETLDTKKFSKGSNFRLLSLRGYHFLSF